MLSGLICHVVVSVGFVCSTQQEIKHIFYIVYLFDEMFSDSSNEWLNTDVHFSRRFSLSRQSSLTSVETFAYVVVFIICIWATGQPWFYIFWWDVTWYAAPSMFFSDSRSHIRSRIWSLLSLFICRNLRPCPIPKFAKCVGTCNNSSQLPVP